MLRCRSDGERQRGLHIPIDGQVDLIGSVLLELEVLYIQDQVDHSSGGIVADVDGDVAFELGANGIAVGVDDENAYGVVTGFDLRKADAGGNTACPVANGEFPGKEIVKCSQHIQLAPLIRCGVT